MASKSQQAQYQGDAVVQVIPSEQVSGSGLDPQQLLQLTAVYLEVSKTANVYVRGARSMQPPVSRDNFTNHVSSATKGDLGLIDLTGMSASPKQAAAYANAYAQGFVAYLRDQQLAQQNANLKSLTTQNDQATAQIQALSGKVPTAAIQSEISSLKAQQTAIAQKIADLAGNTNDRISVIENADVPSAPSSPRPKRDAALALHRGAAAQLRRGPALVARRRALLLGRGGLDGPRPPDHRRAAARRARTIPRPIEAFRGLRTGIAYATFETPDTLETLDAPGGAACRTARQRRRRPARHEPEPRRRQELRRRQPRARSRR